MREPLAVLSDTHGNIRALESVLDEIARRGIRRIVHLGDALYGPFDPRPAAERLMALGALAVAGNEDRILVEAERRPSTASRAFSRTAATPLSRVARFTRSQLEPRHFAWLASLPRTISDGGALFFHGTPSDDTAYLLSRVSDGALIPRTGAEIDSLLGDVPQSLVLCGHDHTPRIVRRKTLLLVNPGSVGCPAYVEDSPEPHVVENGSPLARFVVVFECAEKFSAELVAVPYAAAGAAAEALANGFADWATWIATGRVQ